MEIAITTAVARGYTRHESMITATFMLSFENKMILASDTAHGKTVLFEGTTMLLNNFLHKNSP